MSAYFEVKTSRGTVSLDDNIMRIRPKREMRLSDSTDILYESDIYVHDGYQSPNNVVYDVTTYTFTLEDNEIGCLIKLTGTAKNLGVSFWCDLNTDDGAAKRKLRIMALFVSNYKSSFNANDVKIIVLGTPPPSDKKYGFEVFNSLGEKIYNSSDKLIRVNSNLGMYQYTYIHNSTSFPGSDLPQRKYIGQGNDNTAFLVTSNRVYNTGYTGRPHPDVLTHIYGISEDAGNAFYESRGALYLSLSGIKWPDDTYVKTGVSANSNAQVLFFDVQD